MIEDGGGVAYVRRERKQARRQELDAELGMCGSQGAQAG